MKKTLFLLMVILLAACAGTDPAVIDQAETALRPATVEVAPSENIVQSSINDEEDADNSQPTAESEALPSEPTQTPLQPARQVEPTAEPYPAQTTGTGSEGLQPESTQAPLLPAEEIESTADPYPVPTEREPKSSNVPYPSQEGEEVDLPVYGYRILNEFPHDPEAFTQGLVVTNNGQEFIEGTGLWGQSTLRRVNIDTGEVLQFHALPGEVFGEGLTEFDDKIFQLTWQSNLGFIYDSQSFEQVGEFEYPHQGWGITHDGQEFMVSDGTSTIYFWDAQTLEETRQIQVTAPSGPITRLNELEYYQGEILANVWQTDLIARISPDDGQVLGWIDLTGLYDVGENADSDDVLNGIAYDEQADKLYVTGKRWPVLFEIELVEDR